MEITLHHEDFYTQEEFVDGIRKIPGTTGQESRSQNKHNRQQLNRNQDAHNQRPTSLSTISGTSGNNEPAGCCRATEQRPGQWGALEALLQEEPVQAPGTAAAAAGLPTVWELGGARPVPNAVPMRHVQRSVDTEVLSRRWELQVLGFSHQAQEVLPRKRKKKAWEELLRFCTYASLTSISCHSFM